jgi:hypothetical protein
VVAPGGDDLYIITPELAEVMYCDGSLTKPCIPVWIRSEASGNLGHVLVSFASSETVYVEHMTLSDEFDVANHNRYILERCTVVEPGLFSNCEVVRNSPDGHYLDLVFANNGQNVYAASAIGDNEQDERFFNPFKYLASLFAFRKPGPNVYVTQHVNLCYGGNCNITIEDIMEFTLGNITYDYSKHRSLPPGIGNGSSQDKGFVWHVCDVHAANFTECKPVVDLHNAIAVTRPVFF